MAEVTQERKSKIDEMTSQLSAHIWGHRFKEGQRGPEYVLEFLNVLFGTGYRFDQDTYSRKKSVGLRRFIFQGEKEGARREILVLKEEVQRKLAETIDENDSYVLKQFLRNQEIVLYSVKGEEADRSWFARSLYPLHESLLFFELRIKGEKESIERNFFARGGELYFLMLSHGLHQDEQRQRFIEGRFRELLTRNKIIQRVVDKINTAFGEVEVRDRSIGTLRSDSSGDKPTLPESALLDNGELFESFTHERESLLLLDLDIYEMFRLLTSLVCFQLSRYFDARAKLSEEELVYFIDCLDGQNKQILQTASRSFERHANAIKERLDAEFELKVSSTLGDREQVEKQLPLWKAEPDKLLDLFGLGKLRSRKGIIVSTLQRCRSGEDVFDKLIGVIRETVSEDLKKHQISIKNVISRDGGFATYRKGPASNYRYTSADSFLQMLVFTIVRPGQKMEYHSFLDRLYKKYGIVIGDSQAKQSGLYRESRLNVRHFQDNEKALREKLQHNGLLIEFSDATAMICNPNTCVTGVNHD